MIKICRISRPLLPRAERALTLGNFDGLHIGHLSLMDRVKRLAFREGILSSAMIFDPPPHGENAQIMSLAQKMELFEKIGLDELLIASFSAKFKSVAYDSFLSSLSSSGVRHLVVGPFASIGKGREGNVEKMKEFCRQNSMRLEVLNPVEGASSTNIRKFIKSGEVRMAAHLLSRPHFVEGLVARGLKNGRRLGFPTANLGGLIAGMVPGEGVYCGYLQDGEGAHPAAISVGSNPSMSPASRKIKIEANIMDGLDHNLYGRRVKVYFLEKIRNQAKFPSFALLEEAISKDVAECKRLLDGKPLESFPF